MTIEQAVARTQGALDQYNATFPDLGGDWAISLEPLHEALFGDMRTPLLTLQAAVGFVLLICCANLAALLLTRAASRQREIAVRGALGQSRFGIVRQLLIESLVLSLAGGAVGAALAWVSLNPLLLVAPAFFPRLESVGFDFRVLLFSIAAAVLTAIVFGLVPAWQTSRLNLVSSLHESGRGASVGRSRRIQLSVLVAVQIALACTLLTGAGLMIRSFVKLQAVDFGVETSRLLSFRVQLPNGLYMTQPAAPGPDGTFGLVDYHPTGPILLDRIREALRGVPGVTSAAGTAVPPFAGGSFTPFRVEGGPPGREGRLTAAAEYVTPDYFDTMQMQIVQGRDFAESDQAGSPWVTVVNQALVDQYWKDQNPIGKRLLLSFYDGDSEPAREVVGVVTDTRIARGAAEPRPVFYMLHRQQSIRQRPGNMIALRTQMTFLMRTAGDPLALAGSVRDAVARVDSSIPVTELQPVDSYLSAQIDQPRFIATLFSAFAAIALVIGVIGIYGVTAHGVTQRFREFGIRRALGATTVSVLNLVLRHGAIVLVIGVAIGVGASLMLTQFVESFLWGVEANDVATFVTTATLLAVVGVAAMLIPALRATSVDPLVTLRHE